MCFTEGRNDISFDTFFVLSHFIPNNYFFLSPLYLVSLSFPFTPSKTYRILFVLNKTVITIHFRRINLFTPKITLPLAAVPLLSNLPFTWLHHLHISAPIRHTSSNTGKHSVFLTCHIITHGSLANPQLY